MPEELANPIKHSTQRPASQISTPPKTALSGSTFGQRREDIYRRLVESAELCRLKYNGRKELATEKDECVLELCEALEEAFSYGLRQQQATAVVTAASLFQNMQEIVTGNISFSSNNGDNTFWDFCQIHLTPHERERYEKLKQVWTKCGRGKAFIRASLNEHSLKGYLLTWLSDESELRRFYTQWSLLLNNEVSKVLPDIVDNLSKILFAITVDTTELNAAVRTVAAPVATKEEPIIFAPTPVPISKAKNKRKINIVERPIATANSTEDLLNSLKEVAPASYANTTTSLSCEAVIETLAAVEQIYAGGPADPIEPELEFLKQPLPDFYADNNPTQPEAANGVAQTSAADTEYEDKSDTSSQYSKSSSANCSSNNMALEEKLREMSERCLLLETRVAQLSLENRQLVRRLTQHFNESGIDPTSSLATNYLITIPQVKLLKTKRGSSYYAYEIHITMRLRLEHWTVWRRYQEFYKLHKSLLRTHPSVAAVEFPPKKHFGNMNLMFVEERRQQLQIYLLNLVESLPQVEACKSKAELQKVFPFLRER